MNLRLIPLLLFLAACDPECATMNFPLPDAGLDGGGAGGSGAGGSGAGAQGAGGAGGAGP